MNATKWYTLTEFVKYLGREGKCTVEETPKGWFIKLIQKDPKEVSPSIWAWGGLGGYGWWGSRERCVLLPS